MGPVGGQMVQTVRLCDAEACPMDPPADGATYCKGWDEQGGIELRCTNEVHRTRTIGLPDACRIADVSYRMADYWLRCGYVKTLGVPTPGTGHHREITEHEMAVLRLMGVLVRSGVTPVLAARLARDLWFGDRTALTGRLDVTWRKAK